MKLDLLTRAVEGLLVVLLGVMIVLVFGNVVLRYFFNSGMVFSEEVSRFVFMWLTLIGALVVMKDNAHLGMSSVIDRLAAASAALRPTCSRLRAAHCWRTAPGSRWSSAWTTSRR
jgi:TRAP-type C4-dicarboxylate transport system permease small subunit